MRAACNLEFATHKKIAQDQHQPHPLGAESPNVLVWLRNRSPVCGLKEIHESEVVQCDLNYVIYDFMYFNHGDLQTTSVFNFLPFSQPLLHVECLGQAAETMAMVTLRQKENNLPKVHQVAQQG